jgi:hypothetical protein
MIQTQISLPENLDLLLAMLATSEGKKKEEIILEAVKAYVHEARTPEETLALRRRAMGMWKDRTDLRDLNQEQKPLSHEEILKRRRRAFGIWKDRTDLPDFEKIRRSRDLNWGE